MDRSWVSKRPKIESWSPPLPDPDIESELKRVSRLPAGPELDKEATLLEELFKPPPQSFEQAAPSYLRKSPRLATCPASLLQRSESSTRGEQRTTSRCVEHALRSLYLHLPILARVIDIAEGRSPVLATIAAVSSRWFCASHLIRLASFSRRLKCLDRALRFRSHIDFQSADIRVDDDVINLEAAVDLIELETSHLRSLMGVRNESNGASSSIVVAKNPPIAAKISALALHELLIVGRPHLNSIGCNTGVWQQDRRILDPAMLMPLLVRFHRDSISRDARKRLKSIFCAHLEQLTPDAVLSSRLAEKRGSSDALDEKNSNASSDPDGERWRIAAAAVLQWAWVQLAHEELECDRTAHLGILEKSVLLQPRIGIRRIERSRRHVLERLDILRSEPLLGRFLHAPFDAQIPPGRPKLGLRKFPPASAPNASADKLSQNRSALGRQLQSLPALLGTHVGAASSSRMKVEPQSSSTPVRGSESQRYFISESLSTPSLSIVANHSPVSAMKLAAPHRAPGAGNECPRRGNKSENRTRHGMIVPHLALRERDDDKIMDGKRHALAALPRSLRTDVTLREALGFPPKEESVASLCVDDVSTSEPLSPQVSEPCRGVRCSPNWQNWRRPGSAPAHLPWSSPGLRFCTPLRA